MDTTATPTAPNRRAGSGSPPSGLGIGLFDATQNVFVMRAEGMHHYWVRLFFTLLISWLPWILATPLDLRLAAAILRVQWRRFPPGSCIFAACATIGSSMPPGSPVGRMAESVGLTLPGLILSAALAHKVLQRAALVYVILYGLILLVGHVLDSRERWRVQQTETARLNEQLSKAQLNALRRQIEPHFLFNTLNAIAGLVREKTKRRGRQHDRRAERLPATRRSKIPTASRCRSAKNSSSRRSISTSRRCDSPSVSSSASTFPANSFQRRFPA